MKGYLERATCKDAAFAMPRRRLVESRNDVVGCLGLIAVVDHQA